MKELIAAYDEYIALLAADYADNAGFLYAHGYRCPPERVARGEELRAKIAALKSTLSRDQPK